MHAKWLCYNEVHRLVRFFVQRFRHSLEDLLLPLGKIKPFVLVFTHRKRGVSRLDATAEGTQMVTGACSDKVEHPQSWLNTGTCQ